MKILIVEDDHLQVQWMKEGLLGSFHGATVDVITTELEFRTRVHQIANNPPDIIIMDVMLRWTDPSPEMQPPPEDVKKAGFFCGGLRCARLLAEQRGKSHIPVILYSVLEHSDIVRDLQAGVKVHHLRKDSSCEPLIQRIQEILTVQPQSGANIRRQQTD